MPAFSDTPIEYLKGVGPTKGQALKDDLGIFTIADLLHHYPFRYVDRSVLYPIGDLDLDLAYVQIKGVIKNVSIIGARHTKRLVAMMCDTTGCVDLVWFKGINWVSDLVQTGKYYVAFGKPTEFGKKINIAHPEIISLEKFKSEPQSALMPVYSTTEKLKAKGLDSRGIMRLIQTILSDAQFRLPEYLPQDIIARYAFPNRTDTFMNIHQPADMTLLSKAQMRLKWEEFFTMQMRMLRIRQQRKKNYPGIKMTDAGDYLRDFYKNHLPFTLTNAQVRVMKEIRADIASGQHMNRLLQGDVGSGKTLVAFMAMLIAVGNGYQACMMAPTEILAQQHFNNLSHFAEKLGVSLKLLTGSTPRPEKKQIYDEVSAGTLQILIGTHALLEDKVSFKNPGMVIVDEQHRFGVEQRAKLWTGQAIWPHIIVMTATPIPRTLALSRFGDLDYSVIDELPPGRKPVQTAHRIEANRDRVYAFIRQQIALGRQAYIVYPLIEESETLDYQNLDMGYEQLLQVFPRPKYEMGIVHGRMKAEDKELEMQRFKKGITQIMVSTTVIEVGVDVPNATVMLIENAERFGLSQLHQLRGRVGRGADESYCILMTGYKLSAEARTRIKAMCETNDGFRIAEIDMQLRGPGEVDGLRQSGMIGLKLASLSSDGELLRQARRDAADILERDPELQQHLALRSYLESLSAGTNWSRVS